PSVLCDAMNQAARRRRREMTSAAPSARPASEGVESFVLPAVTQPHPLFCVVVPSSRPSSPPTVSSLPAPPAPPAPALTASPPLVVGFVAPVLVVAGSPAPAPVAVPDAPVPPVVVVAPAPPAPVVAPLLLLEGLELFPHWVAHSVAQPCVQMHSGIALASPWA